MNCLRHGGSTTFENKSSYCKNRTKMYALIQAFEWW